MDALISALEWLNPGDPEVVGDASIVTPFFRFWGASGLWVDDEKQMGWLPYIVPRIVMGLQLFNLVLFVDSMRAQGNTYIIATEQLFIVLFMMTVTGKIATYIFQPIRMQQFCRDLESLHARRRREGIPEVNKVLRKARLFTKFCAVYFPLMAVGSSVSLLALMIGAALYKRGPFFSAKYPCDVERSPCLEAMITHDSMMVLACMTYQAITDMFFFDLLNQILAEAKIVNLCFKSIREFAVKEVEQEMEAAASRDAFIQRGGLDEPVMMPGRGPSLVSLVRQARPRLDMAFIASLAQRKLKDEDDKKRAIDLKMKLRLAECVKHHQCLIGLIGDLQTLFNPFLLCHLSNNLTETAVLALHLMLVAVWGVKEGGMIIIEIYTLAIFFGYSWMSNTITSECSKVKQSLYNSDWFDTSDSFKRSMRIIICRSNERVVIRLGGSAPLSLETYREITKTAVSHFLAMRTIASKK